MGLEVVITEKELMELFGIDEKTMYNLRQKGLPYTRLSRARRVYLVSEVLEWIKTNQIRQADAPQPACRRQGSGSETEIERA